MILNPFCTWLNIYGLAFYKRTIMYEKITEVILRHEHICGMVQKYNSWLTNKLKTNVPLFVCFVYTIGFGLLDLSYLKHMLVLDFFAC